VCLYVCVCVYPLALLAYIMYPHSSAGVIYTYMCIYVCIHTSIHTYIIHVCESECVCERER
jgi:hypothetical protein